MVSGSDLIKSYLATLPPKPGVYQMLDQQGQALYVGKAKNLKKRVINYTQSQRLCLRIQRMVNLTHQMTFIVTHTETEALLLEVNLIKKLKPRYNILFTDDKSFSYLLLTSEKDKTAPRIFSYRGAKTVPGTYFGPFASKQSIQTVLELVTKIFQLRTCTDHFYQARSRPCLQYHIKRCSAPCVNKISPESYLDSAHQAKDFLNGHTKQVVHSIAKQMDQASQSLNFEKAAFFRDQIQSIQKLQNDQSIFTHVLKNADIVTLVQKFNKIAIQVFFYREGAHYGHTVYFWTQKEGQTKADVLHSFLGWFYSQNPPPPEILLNEKLTDSSLLEKALTSIAEKKVTLLLPQKGEKKKLLDRAILSTEEALSLKVAQGQKTAFYHEQLQKLLGLDKPPQRIEVFDNSHLFGTAAYGCMIVATPDGFDKKSYRQFKMEEKNKSSDDYWMMHETLLRRLTDAKVLPDLMILDGGKGQLSMGIDVLKKLNLSIPLMAIAKGEKRNAGEETLYLPTGEELRLEKTDPLLYYLQVLRDESHRFAIGTHRKKRTKVALSSQLDSIEGVGPKRRKALLSFFGSVEEIRKAGVSDLEKVPGFSTNFAQKIYNYFHN